MPEAVIVATSRSPIGRANKGSLVGVDAFRLAEVAVGAAIERAGVPTADIDDIVVAESLQGGGVIGRNVAVRLGLDHIPGLADNRHCAAGLSAVHARGLELGKRLQNGLVLLKLGILVVLVAAGLAVYLASVTLLALPAAMADRAVRGWLRRQRLSRGIAVVQTATQ